MHSSVRGDAGQDFFQRRRLPHYLWRMIDALAPFALVSFHNICLYHHKYRCIRRLYDCVNTDPESRTAMRSSSQLSIFLAHEHARLARAACKDPSWNAQFHVSRNPLERDEAVSSSPPVYRGYRDDLIRAVGVS